MAEQDRQTIGRANGAGQARLARKTAVGLLMLARLGVEFLQRPAVDLAQKHRPRAQGGGQKAYVVRQVQGRVAHPCAQVQPIEGRLGHAAMAGSAQRAHLRRRWPIGAQNIVCCQGLRQVRGG
jgi:hypothetical protein